MGHQPITTERTQATPCWPVLLPSEKDQERRKKIDRQYEKEESSMELDTLARLHLLIALIIVGVV